MTPRVLTLALIGSLALNLFLVGTVVGVAVSHGRHDAPSSAPGRGMRQPLWRAVESLPAAHRQAYVDLLRRQAEPVGSKLDKARELRRQAWTEFGSGALDEAALSRRLADARALDMDARGEVEDQIARFAAGLPPGERAELAKGLANSGLRRGGLGRLRDHQP